MLSSTSSMQEHSGIRTIGKYKILGTLGRGAMGVVYKAQDPEIGRMVAVKVLRSFSTPMDKQTEAQLERFKSEARSAGNLRHPSIITVFEVSSEGSTPYIVMDYLEGESLDAVIAKNGRLEPEAALAVLTPVAAGLDYAHSKGVIHRDIKPSNIIIDRSGNSFIVDFGVASMGGSTVAPGAAVVGTPGYMSPEQILNRELTTRSDLFSLAVVAFECFTGKRPFQGDNFTTVINNILNTRPLSLTELVPSLPLSLEAELEKALSKQASDRYPTGKELVAALAKSLGLSDPAITSFGGVVIPRKRKLSEWKTFGGDPQETEETMSDQTKNNPPEHGHTPKDTGSGFSPWRFERRGIKGEDFAVALPSQSAATPGALFEHAGSVAGPIRRESTSVFRVLSLVFGVVCLLLAAMIVYVLFFDSATTEPVPERNPSIAHQLPPPVDSSLSIPNVDVAPLGKAVSEMTDREILGVIVRGDAGDDLVLKALEEAKRRRLANLSDVTVSLLQSDSYIVRIEALKTLAILNDRRMVAHIVPTLEDHDPLVRGHAARALASLGDRKAVSFLKTRYIKEDSPEVKVAIKQAIEKINGFPMTE